MIATPQASAVSNSSKFELNSTELKQKLNTRFNTIDAFYPQTSNWRSNKCHIKMR